MRRSLALLVATLVVAGCHHRAPPAPAPAPAPAGPSLYTRLGGLPAVRAVVDSFVTDVGADTTINAFFRGVDLANLKELISEQLCQATGGPCIYTGRAMRVVHRGMHITDAQYDSEQRDMGRALDQNHVPEAEKQEVLRIVESLRSEIVGK